jgi:hypothetical protein
MGDLENAEQSYRDALSQNARQVKTYAKYMEVVRDKYEGKEEEAREKGAPKCVRWLIEENKTARRKIASAAGLALSSNVLEKDLDKMNSTTLLALDAKKRLCVEPAEL